MQIYSLPEASAQAGSAYGRELQVIASAIGCIGAPRFGELALSELNKLMPLGWWSVYSVNRDAPPQLHLLGCHEIPDGTWESWTVYRNGLYRHDETFAAADQVVQGASAALTHLQARDVRPDHREQIYTRHRIRERVSLVRRHSNAGMLSMNFYRHEEQPRFSDSDVERLAGMAAPLFSCVDVHLRSTRALVDPAPAVPNLAALTRREREVCERLLRGWTHDGVAADLGIAAGTVKTYRDRAFERLGINSRHELFALTLASATTHLPQPWAMGPQT